MRDPTETGVMNLDQLLLRDRCLEVVPGALRCQLLVH